MRYSSEKRPLPAACYDCGLPYGSPGWMDALVSDEVWEIITPDLYNKESGLLCITCMARRCHEAGLADVPMSIVSGVFVSGKVVSIQPIILAALNDD